MPLCIVFFPIDRIDSELTKIYSLLPYIMKDVSTFGVATEERTIFRAWKLDLIYAQFGILYEIIPNAPRSNHDPKVKLGPHFVGIVGFVSVKVVDHVTHQMQKFVN